MKTAMTTLCTIGIMLAAWGMADAIDRRTEAVISAAASFRDSCLPGAGETSIIVSDGRVARCRILSTASTSIGMAPRLISSAVVEVMP